MSHTLESYRTWAAEALHAEPFYSVVVPTYNEERRIVPTVGAIAAHLCSLGRPWELIIVDDGSTDETVDVVRRLGLVNARVLAGRSNRGKGSAVRRGMLAARGQVILFADADQSTPIEQLSALETVLDKGFDVVIGSRAAAGAHVDNKSLQRRVVTAGLRLFVHSTLRLPIADTQCGFKVFTPRAVDELFTRQRIDGFAFDLEVLYLARKRGLRVVEVPVAWFDAPGSKVAHLRVAPRFVRDVGRIVLNQMVGRYHQPVTTRTRPVESAPPRRMAQRRSMRNTKGRVEQAVRSGDVSGRSGPVHRQRN